MTLLRGFFTREAQRHHQCERGGHRHRSIGIGKGAEVIGDVAQRELRLTRWRRTTRGSLPTKLRFGQAGAIGHRGLLYGTAHRICLGRYHGSIALHCEQGICLGQKFGNGFRRSRNGIRRCGLKGQQRRSYCINDHINER